MTAVLPAPQDAAMSTSTSASVSTSASPQPQTKAQSRPASEAIPSDTPSSSPHLQSSQSSNFTPRPQHLAAPAARSPSLNSLTRVRSRSRDSAPSRRQSRLSTRTVSTRPSSSIFPLLPSSLSYALVRDFAYPAFHPLHYGPQPHDSYAHASESGTSSPAYPYASDIRRYSDRRLSDPPPSWENNRGMWSAGPWGGDGGSLFGISGGGATGDQLPSTSFGYDSDEEDKIEAGKLTKNHRKSKSFAEGAEITASVGSSGRSFSQRSSLGTGGKKKEQKKDMSHLGTGLDSQGFFTPGATDIDDGDDLELDQGVDAITYLDQLPDDEGNHSQHEWLQPEHHHGALDESFAGPSLALYTFEPENANELALKEGQIVEVGYRHGQGWLVAMDLETREQGLVPEEYVRLLSDIEGWPVEDDEDDDDEEELDLAHEHDGDDVTETGSASLRSEAEESKAVNVETAGDRGVEETELPDRSRDMGSG